MRSLRDWLRHERGDATCSATHVNGGRRGHRWSRRQRIQVRPNKVGRGCNVASASYIVDTRARGQEVGRALGTHSLERARALGFRAMQFNFVVSTNDSAVKLWRSLGFEVVGTLPGAFLHRQRGYVDALVMFRCFT